MQARMARMGSDELAYRNRSSVLVFSCKIAQLIAPGQYLLDLGITLSYWGRVLSRQPNNPARGVVALPQENQETRVNTS